MGVKEQPIQLQFPRLASFKAPRLNKRFSNFSSDRRQQTIDEIQQSDRFSVWRESHPAGSGYDFTIFEFLTQEKKLKENVDFRWMTQASQVPVDYFFPTRSMAWALSSRSGLSVRNLVGLTDPTSPSRIGSLGVHLVNVFVESLNQDAKGTLSAAWSGVERP